MRTFASNAGWSRRVAWATGLLLAGVAVAAPVAAQTEPAPAAAVGQSAYTDTLEVQATDTVASAVAFSRLAFPAGADEVVLARHDGFADAFASGLLQSQRPLLLTGPGGVDARTAEELRRLGARRVVVLGGPAALGPEVTQAVEALGVTVDRLAGATRIETAVAIAEDQAPTAPVAILSRAWTREGEAPAAMFVDAMVAGGWAAARGWPVLLTGTGQIPDATARYVERAGVRTVHIVGGPAAVSETARVQLAALGVELARVSGASRYDTGAQVASLRGDAQRFVLVDGEGGASWAAGFAAAAYSARFGAPILPVSGEGVPAAVTALLRGEDGRRGLLCGPGVPQAVCHDAAEQAGQVRRAEADLDMPDGDVLDGEITNPGGVAAITVIGCGMDRTLHPGADGRFSIPLTGSDCRLTVRIEHTDGTTFDQSFSLEPGGVREHPVVPRQPADDADDAGDDTDDGDTDDGDVGDESDGEAPSDGPTEEPSDDPTDEPSDDPTDEPSDDSVDGATDDPTEEPTEDPSEAPSEEPTEEPSEAPSEEPTEEPTQEPTEDPTEEPSDDPDDLPVDEPICLNGLCLL